MTSDRLHTYSGSRGFALVVVMWVVLIAGLMLIGVARATRVNLATAYNELASVQAHWLARAGLEQAIAVLEDDDRADDSSWDYWYSDEFSFKDVEFDTGTFSVIAPPAPMDNPRNVRYGLIDHCGRLNINHADAAQLARLCDLADWQVNSILDWRDTDNDTRPAGAEALHYHHLDYPYMIRNGPFRTIRELRLVRGIDEFVFSAEDANLNGILDNNENDASGSAPNYDNADGQLSLGLAGLTTVYAYELNKDASGSDRVNVNTVDKQTLTDRFSFTDALAEGFVNSGNKNKRFDNLMALLDVKAKQDNSKKESDDENKVKKITVKWLAEHLDELTLTDDDRLPGRVNVNSASRQILLALDKMNEATAEAIIRRQDSGQGPFSSVGDLFLENVITEDQFKAFAEKLTVRSSVFEIRSVGTAKWGIQQEIVAVVDRGSESMSILYWYQSE